MAALAWLGVLKSQSQAAKLWPGCVRLKLFGGWENNSNMVILKSIVDFPSLQPTMMLHQPLTTLTTTAPLSTLICWKTLCVVATLPCHLPSMHFTTITHVCKAQMTSDYDE